LSTSKSLLAYAQLQTVLDRAIESANGVRVKQESSGKARNFVQRCYTFRALDRQRNSKLYDPSDPNHGTSPYDVLVIRQVENEVFITKGEEFEVEEL